MPLKDMVAFSSLKQFIPTIVIFLTRSCETPALKHDKSVKKIDAFHSMLKYQRGIKAPKIKITHIGASINYQDINSHSLFQVFDLHPQHDLVKY